MFFVLFPTKSELPIVCLERYFDDLKYVVLSVVAQGITPYESSLERVSIWDSKALTRTAIMIKLLWLM